MPDAIQLEDGDSLADESGDPLLLEQQTPQVSTNKGARMGGAGAVR